MKKDKIQALPDFRRIIENSWTFGRMTDTEKKRWSGVLAGVRITDIQGTYVQRWAAYNAVYGAFLSALGYDGPEWREPSI